MKAVRIYKTGGTDVLQYEDVEVSDPLPDEIQINLKAIGLNFIDTYYRTGLYQTALPTGLGFEGAGVVVKTGSKSKRIKPGDRVAFCNGRIGAYAELFNINEKDAVILPAEISFEEAAAMMLKGLTVQYLFRQVYKLEKDQTILFHAAAGGVGLIACQWARHLGVKLIGTVSSEEKAQEAKKHGAFEIINYQREDIVSRVNEITEGKKVPVVYDSVGKSTWEQSLDCLSPRGLMVSFGNASGPVTGVNLSILSQKGSLYVTRPTLGVFINTPEKLQAAADELFDLVKRKIIQIKIGQKFSLKDVKKAHEELESRRTQGSTVLFP